MFLPYQPSKKQKFPRLSMDKRKISERGTGRKFCILEFHSPPPTTKSPSSVFSTSHHTRIRPGTPRNSTIYLDLDNLDTRLFSTLVSSTTQNNSCIWTELPPDNASSRSRQLHKRDQQWCLKWVIHYCIALFLSNDGRLMSLFQGLLKTFQSNKSNIHLTSTEMH